MTEAERIVAVPKLMDWRHRDDTVRDMVAVVLSKAGVLAIGNLAHYHPEVFDELFEECEAIIENDQ